MPDTSPRLGLPYLQPSQAQKHVTHNEALQRLDILTQLTVITMGATTPPAEPAVGDIHALGEAPVAVWAGQDGKLAFWDGSAWQFLIPQEGWRAFDLGNGNLQVFEGGVWTPEVPDLQNLDGVGVGTTSDAINRLSVASTATLLTHAGAGHQLKVNKAAAGDTASLLFQSDWTGHAEMGLSGDTSFALKASADGSTWFEMLRVDPATKELVLSPGATVKARLSETALQVDVPVTGAAVQADKNDTTAGRLMGVGAFGLGTNPDYVSAANALDTAPDQAWIAVGTANVATVNGPSGAAGGVVFTGSFSATNKHQTYCEISGVGHTYTRFRNVSGWSSWTRGAVGEVQSSSYDATAGRLMGVRAFGLGAAPDTAVGSNALDTAPDQAWVKVRTADVLTVNGPTDAAGGVSFTATYGTNNKHQTYVEIAGRGNMYTRRMSAGAWGGWKLHYQHNTILGTVSQSSGDATGALIERGSNSNGEYVRFADGTQICTTPELGFGSILNAGLGTRTAPYITDTLTLTWPAPFIDAPSASHSAWQTPAPSSATRGLNISTISGPTATGWDFIRFERASDIIMAADINARFTATGRWF